MRFIRSKPRTACFGKSGHRMLQQLRFQDAERKVRIAKCAGHACSLILAQGVDKIIFSAIFGVCRGEIVLAQVCAGN